MRGVSVPNRSRSLRSQWRFGNLRIVMHVPRTASGGITALTREPSLRRASSSGDDSSIRRPSGVTIRSSTERTDSSSVKRSAVGWMRPARSM